MPFFTTIYYGLYCQRFEENKVKKAQKRKAVDPSDQKFQNLAPVKISATEPDKIGCPICSKFWDKTTLRNHLFYGHHMKTSEVEAILMRLKDPNSSPKQETVVNERTPCPMCDRSFKVFPSFY